MIPCDLAMQSRRASRRVISPCNLAVHLAVSSRRAISPCRLGTSSLQFAAAPVSQGKAEVPSSLPNSSADRLSKAVSSAGQDELFGAGAGRQAAAGSGKDHDVSRVRNHVITSSHSGRDHAVSCV